MLHYTILLLFSEDTNTGVNTDTNTDTNADTNTNTNTDTDTDRKQTQNLGQTTQYSGGSIFTHTSNLTFFACP